MTMNNLALKKNTPLSHVLHNKLYKEQLPLSGYVPTSARVLIHAMS
jgi:hypothetical protein